MAGPSSASRGGTRRWWTVPNNLIYGRIFLPFPAAATPRSKPAVGANVDKEVYRTILTLSEDEQKIAWLFQMSDEAFLRSKYGGPVYNGLKELAK